jgi:hypothetical protein
VLSCKNFTVSEMLGICFAQLSAEHFDQAVQELQTLYDINLRQYSGLKGWVTRHQQRLRTPLATHVKPSQVDLWDPTKLLHPPSSERQRTQPEARQPKEIAMHVTIGKRGMFWSIHSSLFVPHLPRLQLLYPVSSSKHLTYKPRSIIISKNCPPPKPSSTPS